jgi:hypothetical protein
MDNVLSMDLFLSVRKARLWNDKIKRFRKKHATKQRRPAASPVSRASSRGGS